MLEQPCVRSRGHIFSQTILDEYENGSCRVKNYFTKSNLWKTFCMLIDQIFRLLLMKLGQSVCLDEILYIFWKWVMLSQKVGHYVKS